MPAQSYDIAYNQGGNVIPAPHVNFLDEGNSAKYVSMAVGGGKRSRRRRTHKKRGTKGRRVRFSLGKHKGGKRKSNKRKSNKHKK